MEEKNKTYGLLTAIAMIVGTVVGSGIYFKADDILSFTGGNVTLGVLVILLGAVNIIFGSLISGYFTTLFAIVLFGGVQLISIGILGEYIGKIYYEVKRRPHFIVEETNIQVKDKELR